MSSLITRQLREERSRLQEMLPEMNRNGLRVFNLTYEDVLDAHFSIADYFFRDEYGMAGVGFRDVNSFVSTVERQFTGFFDTEVYESEFEVVATLLYGIIKNHPFYDGNKRTAFLCSLLQLHRMGRTITVPEKEFEDLMVEIADNSIRRRSAFKEFVKKRSENPEVKYLARYLQKNTRKTAQLSGTIKFRELRQILEANGFKLNYSNRGTIDIIKMEEQRIPRFFFSDRIERKNIVVGNIAYHGEGVDVPDNTLKMVRQLCGLTEQDGFDGEVLIRDAQPTFRLIASYRSALQNLAYR
jgi:death-on-curing protein